MMKPLLIVLSALLIIPNFIDININDKNEYNKLEQYSPGLIYIKSIAQLEHHTDSLAKEKNIQQGSEEYFILLEEIISQRFYHGFSRYKLKQNWVAAVSEWAFGYGLACKVYPDDILQNRAGACSQQAAVMMAIAKLKNIDYRSIGFPHHYAMEVKIKGNWYFLDPNMEPHISKEQRLEQNWHGNSDELKAYYDGIQHRNMDNAFGIHQRPSFGAVNANPAPHLKTFHSITWLLSRTIWCLPLLYMFAFSRRKKAVLKPAFNIYWRADNLFPLLPA